MLSYQVDKTIHIAQPAQTILTFLADFKNWPSWSPWVIQEPDCPLSYSGEQGQVGCGYDWNGTLIGAGGMTLTVVAQNRLEMALNFLKPFKSSAKITFAVSEDETGCLVTWTMSSKVPWFLFFLKGLFKRLIGMDFQRGLLMLKSQLETGAVHSKVDVLGQQPWPATEYIGFKGQASIKDLGPVMRAHYERLNAFMAEHNIQASGAPFALYQRMNMKTTVSDFISCIPVATKDIAQAPADMVRGQLPACNSFVIRHTGEYPYLGNAWATAMSASRFYKVKIKRVPMGIERYENDPLQTPARDLVTDVVLLTKA